MGEVGFIPWCTSTDNIESKEATIGLHSLLYNYPSSFISMYFIFLHIFLILSPIQHQGDDIIVLIESLTLFHAMFLRRPPVL